MHNKRLWSVMGFSALYLIAGGAYFARDFNIEFIIYVGVIVAIFAVVFATMRYTRFPLWMLWLLSVWGLMHVAGGAVHMGDHVLFAQRIYPFLDKGGEFYILKYDQVVHGYLYALVALMSYHLLRVPLAIRGHAFMVSLLAVLISIGVSSLNEIMEFLIAVNLAQNGVGGYENTMLDLCFNTGGAVAAVIGYRLYECRRQRQVSE